MALFAPLDGWSLAFHGLVLADLRPELAAHRIVATTFRPSPCPAHPFPLYRNSAR
jgi:hypothetical protein